MLKTFTMFIPNVHIELIVGGNIVWQGISNDLPPEYNNYTLLSMAETKDRILKIYSDGPYQERGVNDGKV